MDRKFKGVFTAIITPFAKDGSVDWQNLARLVELQVEAGVAGIVPCGTTGESPTLSHGEQIDVIRRVVEWTTKLSPKKRCLVVAGTGSNNTAHAVSLSREAQELGADACLVVNPYYNKPTQEGLYRHFKAVANAVTIPIIVYNIKGRTAVNVETPTLLRLVAECRNILAVKEASGDLKQMEGIIREAPDYFSVLSGDDNLTLELIRRGGTGVVSVASNLIPARMVELVDAALAGDWATAERINQELLPLYDALFIETNPIPIKAAVATRGLCEEVYRLPMCEMSRTNREKLLSVLSAVGI